MSFRIVAFHYPKPEHRTEMVQRLERAAEVLATAPGCIDVEVWKEQSSGALVTTAKFESQRAGMNALRNAAGKADMAFDERESRPRDIYRPSFSPC
jgi:hypothetical protein